MPYDLKTKSGIILRNIPDDVQPDAPELKALVQQQLRAREPKPVTPIVPSDPGEASRMALEGMSGTERVMANIGAGTDSLLTGLKQVGGYFGGEGVSDEELDEKRARDAALAESTTGGKALQIVGEAAPAALIPGGAFARPASWLLKTLGSRSGGLLRRGAAAAGETIGKGAGRTIADSALAGAAGGAAGPVRSDESRLANAAVGGTIGAALPATLLGARAGAGAMTRGGAQERAARIAQEAAGDDPATLRRLARYDMDKPDIPLTSAAAAENPGLARLEAGARARNGADFYDFDQGQGRAVYEKVMGATEDSTELAARRGARAEEWDSNWRVAETVADPQVFAKRVPEFRANLEQALRSSEAANPAVEGVLEDILKRIDKFGDDFSPAHLQQIRANLNQRGKAMPTNAYQAAPRDSAAVGSLINEIDDILNQTTKGAWDAVKGGYETASRGVDASKASGRIRESFMDPKSGRIHKALDPRGEIAEVTEGGLDRALKLRHGPGRVEDLLEPEASRVLNRTLDTMRRQGIVQRVKRSATSGGGSNTSSDNFAAAAAGHVVPGGSLGRQALEMAKDYANRKRDRALLDALRDPAEMMRLLTLSARNPGALSPAQQAIVQSLRASDAVAGADVLTGD